MPAIRQWAARIGDSAARAVRGPGHERDQLLLQAKTVAAVVASWSTAHWLLSSTAAPFSPFTTLLVLQGSVYRSIWHSVRYAAAVAVGVMLAAGFGAVAGVQEWSLAVLTVCALAAGRLQTFGPLRLQVPVTALFAFTSGGGTPQYSVGLLAAVAIGIGCGLAVTVLLAPPTRYRIAEAAVAELSSSVCDLLHDMTDTLRESTPGMEKTDEWARRAQWVESVARRARSSVEAGEEMARFNPRRLLTGGYRTMPGFHQVITTLDRVGFQARSMAHGLSYAAYSDYPEDLARDFLTSYADVLAEVAAGAETFGDHGARVPQNDRALAEHIAEGRRHYRTLASEGRREHMRVPEEWPLYGVLLTDAHRILDELERSTPPATVPAAGTEGA